MNNFPSFEELRKLTPSIWLMLLSLLSATVVSGGLYLYCLDTATYETAVIGKLIYTAFVITMPVLFLNAIIACCFLKKSKLISQMQAALTWGGVFTTLIFVFLVLYVKIGLSYGEICTPFLLGSCMELLIIASLIIASTRNNKIRRRYRWLPFHAILVLLNIISMVFILQIVFGLIPLFNSNLSTSRIDLINGFVVDMSVGIMTSTFFYYLLVYIGERRRSKCVRRVIQWRLDTMAANMQIVIGYYIYKYGIEHEDNKFLTIKPESFIQAGNLTRDTIDYWFRWGKSDTAMNVSGSTERGFVCNYVDMVKHHADRIIESTVFAQEDTDLIELVDRIARCGLVEHIGLLNHNPKLDMFRGNYGNELMYFYQYYCELAYYVKQDVLMLKEDDSNLGIAFIYK